MKRTLCRWLAIACCALAPASAAAQTADPDSVRPPADYPRGRVSGYIFGDLYYNVSGDPGHSYNASGVDTARAVIDGSTFANGQPRVIGKDLNGLLIRRIYFQVDNDLSPRFATRFRLEADSRALTSDGKIGVYVKAAYLQWKELVPRGSLFFGMVGTPTWETSEDFWAYRSIEKTIADFRGLASSADLGVQLKGYLDGGHRIGYNALLGTGTGQRPEDNRYKRAYLALPLRPIENLVLEPYADYEDARTPAGETDRATFKLFGGYEFRRFAIGAEVVERVSHTVSGPNRHPFGFSVFGRATMSERLQAFARFDRWQPDRRADDRIDSDLYIGGFDWTPIKDVHVMPNVIAAQYHAQGTAVEPANDDLQARLTFYARFSKP